jgi:hypothetical protein
LTPSKAALHQAAPFQHSSGTARTEVISPELLFEQLAPMHDSQAAFDLPLGWEALPAFAHRLEKKA